MTHMTKPAIQKELTISKPVKIGQTHSGQLTFLCQMMHWLRENDLPYGGSDSSLYIFAETFHVIGCVEMRWNDDFLWIQAIYVDPGIRRRGIGERLLHAATTAFQGPISIGLGTRPSNAAMKALANKMGFTHEIHEHWRK